MTDLLLVFCVFALLGKFILWRGWWRLGLAATPYAIVQLAGRSRADGGPLRSFFILPTLQRR